jgi:hypothetical protein
LAHLVERQLSSVVRVKPTVRFRPHFGRSLKSEKLFTVPDRTTIATELKAFPVTGKMALRISYFRAIAFETVDSNIVN